MPSDLVHSWPLNRWISHFIIGGNLIIIEMSWLAILKKYLTCEVPKRNQASGLSGSCWQLTSNNKTALGTSPRMENCQMGIRYRIAKICAFYSYDLIFVE